jgi:hypothetical protein
MGNRVWQVPQELFVTAWNEGGTFPEVVKVVKELARGQSAEMGSDGPCECATKGRSKNEAITDKRSDGSVRRNQNRQAEEAWRWPERSPSVLCVFGPPDREIDVPVR